MISSLLEPQFLSLFKKDFFFFLMWTIFKVFIESAKILLLLCVLASRHIDLSSPTRDRTSTPAKEGEILTNGLAGMS